MLKKKNFVVTIKKCYFKTKIIGVEFARKLVDDQAIFFLLSVSPNFQIVKARNIGLET